MVWIPKEQRWHLAVVPYLDQRIHAPMRPTLLLLHGFPLDHHLWDPNRDALSAAADLIVPDLRGFGRTTTEVSTTTMEHFAQDLFKLLDGQGVQQVIPCGLSMGGYVAMAMAELAPHRLQGLILCNTRLVADTAEARIGREATATDALAKGMTVIARAMAPKLLGKSTRQHKPHLITWVENMIGRQAPAATAAAARGMAQRTDRTPVLAGFHRPALVITGDEDELMPLPTSEHMHRALPHGSMVVLEGCGHLSNVEAPERFNTAVLEYLGSL